MSKHTRNQLPLPANFELNHELHHYFNEQITSPNLRFLKRHLPAACKELRSYKEDIESRVRAGEPLKHIADLYRHKMLQFRTLCETANIKVPAKQTSKKKKSAPVVAPESPIPANGLIGITQALSAFMKETEAHHAAAAKERKAIIAVLVRIANCRAISVSWSELVQFSGKPEQLSMAFQAQAPQACNG